MERKIGEVFEYNGEWYQCIEDTERISCINCCFYNGGHKLCTDESIGACASEYRSDKKSMCFKKLEKVGEPFVIEKVLYQHYKVFDIDNVCGDGFWSVHNYKAKTLTIEIKQNEKDMEENKPKEDNPLTRVVYNYVNGEISDKELIRSIKEMSDEYPYNKNNLKPFSLELAKQGKPVCTRDGRKARIICFDSKNDPRRPIVALVEHNDNELLYEYTIEGKERFSHISTTGTSDLMMFPEKKEMWINIYKGTTRPFPGGCMYDTEEEAKDAANGDENYVTTIQIEWEE